MRLVPFEKATDGRMLLLNPDQIIAVAQLPVDPTTSNETCQILMVNSEHYSVVGSLDEVNQKLYVLTTNHTRELTS